ncbi:3044_t:CDS:2, partial [Scutellospora calospora]
MTSPIEVIQYQETTATTKDGLYTHAEEIDRGNQSISSSSSEHLQNNDYASSSSSIEEKKNDIVTTYEEKDMSQQEHKKTNSLRRILKKEVKYAEMEKTAQEEKKSEGLVRVISGIFNYKPKSEKEKRKDGADNNIHRTSSRKSNDNSEVKSRNRRSFIFYSDNEDERNRLSLNLDRFLRPDDKHKSFNNNDMTDMFLPEINGSPIKTYKGRLDSYGSKQTSTVIVLDSPHQTESPISNMASSAPVTPGVTNSLESGHEDLPEIKVESIEEQADEFKDQISYSSANSINEDQSINEQQQKSRPVSQASSSINSEKYEVNDDFKYYNNQAEVEVNKASKSDNNVNDQIFDNTIKVPIDTKITDSFEDSNLERSIILSHQEESSTVTVTPITPPKFPVAPGFVGEEIQHHYLNRDNIVQNGHIYHVEERPQLLSPVSQITEKQIDITQETPQIRQKLEELQDTNESLNSVRKQLESIVKEQSQQIKNQLESKVDEQSQQISKLSSLESIMTRQLELAERMEETMRRLETKVNQQKEELDGLLAGHMEVTVRRLEDKLNEQNREVEGLKLVLEQLQMTHPQQLLLAAGPETHCSTTSTLQLEGGALVQTQASSTEMAIATQQNHRPRDTLVHTLVVNPLVNTIVFSA